VLLVHHRVFKPVDLVVVLFQEFVLVLSVQFLVDRLGFQLDFLVFVMFAFLFFHDGLAVAHGVLPLEGQDFVHEGLEAVVLVEHQSGIHVEGNQLGGVGFFDDGVLVFAVAVVFLVESGAVVHFLKHDQLGHLKEFPHVHFLEHQLVECWGFVLFQWQGIMEVLVVNVIQILVYFLKLDFRVGLFSH